MLYSVKREPSRIGAFRLCQARRRNRSRPGQSAAIPNTIGTVRVACSNGTTLRCVQGPRGRPGAAAGNSTACLRMSSAVAQQGVDPQVATVRSSPIASRACVKAARRACPLRIVRGQIHEHADASHPLRLLCARSKRPTRHHAAEKCP